jgi:hypothetical protein
MRSSFLSAVIAVLLGFGCIASAFQGAPTSVRLEKGSILYAELSRTIDAKKAKVGDPVNAVLVADVLSHGKIVVRRDSKLVGHITEVRPRTKENPESRLGIVFDKVTTKGGDVGFQSLLLAIRPAQRPVLDVLQPPRSMGGSATDPNQDRHYPLSTNPAATPRINSSTADDLKSHDQKLSETGPTDIDGLSLVSPPNGAAQTIVSTQRTVKLESGIGIELRVIGQ